MVLVFVDNIDGQVKRPGFEVLSYGAAVAEKLGTPAEALIFGKIDDLAALGNYGVTKIHQVTNDNLNSFDAQVYAKAVVEAVNKLSADVVVFSHNQNGKSIAPFVSAQLKAGLVSGAVSLPDTSNGFVVKKNVFSGKAFANINIKTQVKIISLNQNSFPITKTDATAAVESLEISVSSPKIKVTGLHKTEGEVPLTEAEIVVSGGRGLKGPENWEFGRRPGACSACCNCL